MANFILLAFSFSRNDKLSEIKCCINKMRARGTEKEMGSITIGILSYFLTIFSQCKWCMEQNEPEQQSRTCYRSYIIDQLPNTVQSEQKYEIRVFHESNDRLGFKRRKNGTVTIKLILTS